jgi:1,4-alpha-glucan branching enzyme
VPRIGYWAELLNSDAKLYGGSGQGNLGGVEASPIALQNRPYSLTINLPPLAVVIFKLDREKTS